MSPARTCCDSKESEYHQPTCRRDCGCLSGGPHFVLTCKLYERGGVKPVYDLHDTTETRYTDPVTGGQKGQKLTQLGALDPLALIALSRVAGYGAEKYAAFNFLKGYDWALSFNAAQRHALLFWAGEDIDAESGQPHVAMAAWHMLALTSFLLRGLGTDTRFQQATGTPLAQTD